MSVQAGLDSLGLSTLTVALRRNAKQKQVMEHSSQQTYKEQLGLAPPVAKALIRSNAAPGAASFLELPDNTAYLMENKKSATAFFRRLGCDCFFLLSPPVAPVRCNNKNRRG